MAQSMHYNGVDLSGSAYGLTVLNATPMPSRAEARLHSRDVPNRHGGYAVGGYVEAQDIEAQVMIVGTSTTDLLAKLDALNRALDVQQGAKAFRFDAIPGRQWYGWLRNRITGPMMGPAAFRTTLVFHCPDPIAYSTDVTTQNVTLDASPKAFNVPGTGVLAGSTFALPVWTFRNTSATPVAGFSFANITRGEGMSIAYTMEENEYIRVDTARGVVEFSSLGADWTIINNAITTSPASFPKLTPGGANSCSVTGIPTGTLAVSYRARFY
jgi:predicted phage tail component-like protein